MPKLLNYSYKNSFARKLTSILTLSGIALVVFVFSAVLMLSNGLEETLVAWLSGDVGGAQAKVAATLKSLLPVHLKHCLGRQI